MRRLERLALRFLLWLFALTAEPNASDRSDDCPCRDCVKHRRTREQFERKRRKMPT